MRHTIRHTGPHAIVRALAAGAALATAAAIHAQEVAITGGADLGVLLSQWGTGGSADVSGDGTVDGADLGALLSAWGPC